jgi:pantoate--beta-alanine ligase
VKVVRAKDELRSALKPLRGGRIGLVPTMGAFHDGHLALFRAAREECDTVVCSLFVNPAQFGQGDDLESYPRDEKRDLELARAEGADFLFAPSPEEMYPADFETWVEPERLARELEGVIRPSHFRGVATICLKLLNIVRPNAAYFGAKDAQQLAVIERLVRDLDLELEIRPVETARDSDGLALSSRNAYLSPAERRIALALPRALALGAEAARDGGDPVAVARAALDEERGLKTQYVAVADYVGPRLLAAIQVGRTRLIDNVSLNSSQNEDPSTGGDRWMRGKDAGSVRISDTGATEDAASRRRARPGGGVLRSETSSKKGAAR